MPEGSVDSVAAARTVARLLAVGGPIFPLIFAGTAFGLAVNLALPLPGVYRATRAEEAAAAPSAEQSGTAQGAPLAGAMLSSLGVARGVTWRSRRLEAHVRGGSAHRLARLLAGVLACAAVLAFGGRAFAVPPAATYQSQLQQKQAQQAAAQAELTQMQADLNNSIAEYIDLGNEIGRVRAQISEVTTELASQSASLDQAQSALTSRTVEMYRGDQMNLVTALFMSNSIDDFITRSHYLIFVSQRDAMLLRDVRLGQAESLYLQQTLADRQAQLQQLQDKADGEQAALKIRIGATQKRAQQLGSDITKLLQPAPTSSGATFSGGSPTTSFNADSVITSANYHNVASMSAADIQSFLDGQPGTLKSYTAKDHLGQTKTAAQMIADAAAYWNISPKVILVTLQKEQSLLSAQSPAATAYQWAMGAGKADSFTVYKYGGFGNQIWVGTQKLRTNADLYKPGATQTIEGTVVHPANDGTFAQYRYTPHFSGVMSFWMLYWRYFGDPNA